MLLSAVGQAYLDLQRQVGADGVQQQFGGLLLAHEHQLQVHVPFDQKAFGHQTDTRHPAEQRHAVRPEARNTQMQSELVLSALPYLIISLNDLRRTWMVEAFLLMSNVCTLTGQLIPVRSKGNQVL